MTGLAWLGHTSANAYDPSNWSPNAVPANGDNMFVGAATTVAFLKGGNYDDSTLNLQGSGVNLVAGLPLTLGTLNVNGNNIKVHIITRLTTTMNVGGLVDNLNIVGNGTLDASITTEADNIKITPAVLGKHTESIAKGQMEFLGPVGNGITVALLTSDSKAFENNPAKGAFAGQIVDTVGGGGGSEFFRLLTQAKPTSYDFHNGLLKLMEGNRVTDTIRVSTINALAVTTDSRSHTTYIWTGGHPTTGTPIPSV